MKMMEESFMYKELTIYVKKDVTHWRAKSSKTIEKNEKEFNIEIDKIANTKNEAIKKAKAEIDRQLEAIEQS